MKLKKLNILLIIIIINIKMCLSYDYNVIPCTFLDGHVVHAASSILWVCEEIVSKMPEE